MGNAIYQHETVIYAGEGLSIKYGGADPDILEMGRGAWTIKLILMYIITQLKML